MRKFAKNALVVLISTVISLAMAEGALRVLGHRDSGSTFTADPLLGWSLRPGARAWEMDEGQAWSVINSHGYRDRERSLAKPPGVFRVAVLGDSYTEARQVDMATVFTALAEAELNRLHCCQNRTVEVLNFGVGGFGTGQELLQLRERVWPFSPDLIVLQVFMGNDIFNNSRALNISGTDISPYFLLKDGQLVLDESFRHGSRYHPTYMALKNFGADLVNGSVLLQAAFKLVRARAQQRELARHSAGAPAAPTDPTAPPRFYRRFLAFQPPTLPSMVEAWQVTEALIAEFGREVRRHGVPLLMIVMPSRHQIHPDPQGLETYRQEYGIESLEYADERVAAVAAQNGFSVLPLSTPLREEAMRIGKYVGGFKNTAPNDGHLNELGHRVVARELVRAICALVSAPERPACG